MTKARFLTIRPSLLKGIFINKKGVFTNKKTVLNSIISQGIKDYTQKINASSEEAFKLIIYDYINRKPLTYKLESELDELFGDDDSTYDIRGDDRHRFFEDMEFDAQWLYNEFVETYNPEYVKELLQQMVEYAKVMKVVYNLAIIADIPSIVKMPASTVKEPLASINIAKLFEFRDYDKSEQELVELCAYIAIKSIISARKSKIAKANIKMILDRAFCGEADLIAKYGTRRRFETLQRNLELNWGVKFLSNNIRGFCVSTSADIEYEHVAEFIENMKKKNRVNALKLKKAEATRKVQEQKKS
ncbi:MAG TPA: hypothetical protein VEC36_01980 [Patescibacteria group bacterium]|nr:hypothetical protein [Patescibacteria group bacterium]